MSGHPRCTSEECRGRCPGPSGGQSMGTQPRQSPLGLERLEDRDVPAVFGTPWPDGQHLTLSFAPDGTAVDGRASTLTTTLNGQTLGANWQREILRAFQTWA